MQRRDFLRGVTAGALGLGLRGVRADETAVKPYGGPNVIIVRFGGGVRRRETIASDATYSPFLKKELIPRGVLFPQMEIPTIERKTGDGKKTLNTSHGEGTLNILTGKYDLEAYVDADRRFLGARFEPQVPTVFEALRKAYDVPAEQALIVNGEDRLDEEFYTFSNHLGFGINYRSAVLSLYRYKVSVLREELAAKPVDPENPKDAERLKTLFELEQRDGRSDFRTVTSAPGPKGKAVLQFHPDRLDQDPASNAALNRFWQEWKGYYGRSGLVNPRGDRLLTELSIWAMRRLKPRLMMINYNDPDYVHWGNPSFYTRGITAIDEGLRQLWDVCQLEPAYRDNTVFVIVPDCGRDANPFMSVPYQHHFNSRSAHEIFCLAVGPGIDKGRVVDRHAEQNGVAATVAGIMGFAMPLAEGKALEEAFG